MIILGVDPGLQATGFGIIDAPPGGSSLGPTALRVMVAGDIRSPRRAPLEERLGRIHERLAELIRREHAETIVLEKIFTHYKHVTTAAMMAHARGVACLTADEYKIPLAEYPPTEVKKSLTGNGVASKSQVARMVGQWLGRSDPDWSHDATDALALAIVHAHTLQQQRNLTGIAS